jgi:hypothetical protein
MKCDINGAETSRMWIAIGLAVFLIIAFVDAIVSYDRSKSGKPDWLTGEDSKS